MSYSEQLALYELGKSLQNRKLPTWVRPRPYRLLKRSDGPAAYLWDGGAWVHVGHLKMRSLTRVVSKLGSAAQTLLISITSYSTNFKNQLDTSRNTGLGSIAVG